MKKDDTEDLLTRQQAADLLGICLTTLDSERRCGNLAYVQFKKHSKVWIPKSAITKYLTRGEHEAGNGQCNRRKR